jgi:GNAT superfamily N-acetyltransferase
MRCRKARARRRRSKARPKRRSSRSLLIAEALPVASFAEAAGSILSPPRYAAGVTSLSTATAADTGVLLSLIRELAEYERLSSQVIATEERIRESLFGSNPRAEALIARVEGDVAGFALYFHNYSTFLAKPGVYLEDLFVRPPFRGRGIGRALLSRLATIALERGCGRFEWAVLDWNKDAIGFYEALGARPMNDWTVYRLTGDALQRLAESDRG